MVETIETGITGADESDNINISQKAIDEVKRIMEENSIPAGYGLRIGVKGGGCSGLMYNLGFDAEARDDDRILNVQDVTIFIDPKSLFYLMGVQLDYTDGLMGRGFTFNNPNAAKTCGCGSSFGV